MGNSPYYDGTKLLSLKDINGQTPEIYMCSANNNAGKTTFFSRFLVNKFLDKKGKFILIYRFGYELEECSAKFFKDIGSLFFPNYAMEQKKRAAGSFVELFLNDESCGYGVSLNNVDNIKKYAHFFSDVNRMYMDEFQSETDKYCTNEINKFRALHKAVARGHGEMIRYVPVYMTANPITILNPYYIKMGISQRLNKDTKFLKGNGFVLEQGYNAKAAEAQKMSAFNKAFGEDSYAKFSAEGVYLNDNYAFIQKPKGHGRYLCTLKYNNGYYGIREYDEEGILYCDDSADTSFPRKITVTTDDHEINYVMLRNNDIFLYNMRYFFQKGRFRFKDLKCKEVILNALAY